MNYFPSYVSLSSTDNNSYNSNSLQGLINIKTNHLANQYDVYCHLNNGEEYLLTSIENWGSLNDTQCEIINRSLPGGRVVESIRSDACRYVVMVNLTHSSRPPTVLHELLG